MPIQLKTLRLSSAEALSLPASRARQGEEAAGGDSQSAAARAALFIEKRREARYPTNDSASVDVKGGGAPLTGTVLDVSKSGLRLRLGTAINKGAEVKITLQRNVVIYGQVRHSRRAEAGFDVGIAIHEMSENGEPASAHIEDDLLSLYVIGKGLTVPEVIKLKQHLVNCEACRVRLGEKDAVINPIRRRKILATPAEAKDPADD